MRILTLLLFVPAVTAGACAPELQLDPAPNIQDELVRFNNPNATVVASIMEAVAGDLSNTRDEVEDSSFVEEVVDLVIEVQDELYNEEGQLDLGGGLTFEAPDGGVTVDYTCEGWSDPPPLEPDPANGLLRLNMRLARGSIAPLVWGAAENCRYPLQVANRRLDASYNGEVALFFNELSENEVDGGIDPAPLGPDTDPYGLEVYVLSEGSVTVEGRSIPINEIFSVTFVEEDGEVRPDELEILVVLPDDTAFVYGFSFSTFEQAVTDITGTFSCSLEERTCQSPSGTFSW
jgi:hypothetical protein